MLNFENGLNFKNYLNSENGNKILSKCHSTAAQATRAAIGSSPPL
jgi:hypothetical protein